MQLITIIINCFVYCDCACQSNPIAQLRRRDMSTSLTNSLDVNGNFHCMVIRKLQYVLTWNKFMEFYKGRTNIKDRLQDVYYIIVSAVRCIQCRRRAVWCGAGKHATLSLLNTLLDIMDYYWSCINYWYVKFYHQL